MENTRGEKHENLAKMVKFIMSSFRLVKTGNLPLICLPKNNKIRYQDRVSPCCRCKTQFSWDDETRTTLSFDEKYTHDSKG